MSTAPATTNLATDERQPLLPPPSRLTADSSVVDPEAGVSEDHASPREKWTKASVFWYSLLWLGIILTLAYIIKGLKESDDVDFDFKAALKRALGGGLSGAAAMVLQVLTLMPLRTIMNYQYRFGTSITMATKFLYNDGGFPRYYAGLTAALFQGPIARFGDTAANVGILALMQSNGFLRGLPTLVKTAFASAAAALFRMVLTPVDTLKTTLQAQGGGKGVRILRQRVKRYGVGSLWYGAWATAAATFAGHYPWFGTYNKLSEVLPPSHNFVQQLARQAFIGFAASVVSDTVSNSLRVVKTYRQVNDTRIGYLDSARAVIAADGLRGLFGRGLPTRILANGLQGLMFSVLWKLFLDLWDKNTKA